MEQHFISKIRQLGEPIRAKGATGLYVYGSRARGDHRPDSDIDIFVDYDPESGFSIVELAAIKRILEGALRMDVHITTRGGLNPRLKSRIESQAIRVL